MSHRISHEAQVLFANWVAQLIKRTCGIGDVPVDLAYGAVRDGTQIGVCRQSSVHDGVSYDAVTFLVDLGY
jgi:hypothetical protein